MISEDFAILQLERIMGMVGFPRGKDAGSYIREMRKALEGARTQEIARQVIDDILREFKRCPSVADIYENISEENNRVPGESAPKCRTCGGNRAITEWFLVTYHGRTLMLRNREALPDFSHEKQQEFGKSLRWDDGRVTADNPYRGDNQQIVTGARKCPVCG